MHKATLSILLLNLVVAVTSTHAEDRSANQTIEIGTRRELFVDDFLIDKLHGKAELRLHHPVPREVSVVHDAPWEGNATAYHSVFKDGDIYRMYYRAWDLGERNGSLYPSRESLCYAESSDGIHWHKPEIGLHDFAGSKANNIVISTEMADAFHSTIGGPAVFRDDNPATPPDERYKTFLTTRDPLGMQPFKSNDGIHWVPFSDQVVITHGAFDSQNLAFWDPVQKKYRAYWRYFTEGTTDAKTWKPAGYRAIRTATSTDLLTWEDEADLAYVDSPDEELYENGIHAYYRAPHLLIGIPVRYVDRVSMHGNSVSGGGAGPEQLKLWPASLRALPERDIREKKAGLSERYGSAITEALFMVSRDGVTFKRWNEAFLRPGIERRGTWNYGQQFVAWTPVETRSTIDHEIAELSFYATEGYWAEDKHTTLRRYTLRLDGFVSLSAPMSGGELVTKPCQVAGQSLSLNFASSAAGGVWVEVQNADGQPIPGFAHEDCDELFGDTVDRTVSWRGKTDVSSLAGQTIRLRFILRDADVYSFQFQD